LDNYKLKSHGRLKAATQLGAYILSQEESKIEDKCAEKGHREGKGRERRDNIYHLAGVRHSRILNIIPNSCSL